MHENITRALVEHTARKLSPQLTTALLLETYCSNSPSRDLIDPRAQTDDVVCACPRSFGVRAERSRAVARAEVFSFSQIAHRLTERAANPVRAGRHLMERQRGQFPLVAAPAATHRSRSRPLAHG